MMDLAARFPAISYLGLGAVPRLGILRPCLRQGSPVYAQR